jgi:serine protease
VKRTRSIVIGSLVTLAAAVAAVALIMTVFVGNVQASRGGSGMEVLHGAHVMTTKNNATPQPRRRSNLFYHGGVGGVGVETGADKVYLIYWGSQWNNNDPSSEAALQQSFFNHVGTTSWNNSVTQYCEGVASGTTSCGASGTHAVNPSGVLGGVWFDNGGAAPSSPTQSQLATEAITAAAHFGNTGLGANTTVQYVINTATGNSSSGFGTQYCAWHSSTSSSFGNIAYTNMPYITDAGGNCGAGFNGLGANAGITIVGGHEFAETETDIYPNGGWLDGSGAENGDKCAWIQFGQGAITSVLMTGASFPVQSLWSNAFNGGAGGCVQSYP